MTHKFLFFVVLGILIVVIWKYYWRLQVMYNSSILSLYTPDSFPISNEFKSNHDEVLKLGTSVAKGKRVVIVTLLRDVERKLLEIEKKAERVGNLFGDYRILIVENDSSDNTRSYLLSWAKRNSKVVILGCGINASKCSIKSSFATQKTDGHSVNRQRIEKMVMLRNIYLEEIKRSYFDWDDVIIWDLDTVGVVYLDGILHTMGYLENESDVTAVCAYGIYRWGLLTLYYDTYAHLDRGDKFHINMKWLHDLKKGLGFKYERGTPPIDVVSCFSGFTIYKIESLLDDDVIYDMSGDDNIECEHVRLNRKIQGRKVVNPSMINFVLLND